MTKLASLKLGILDDLGEGAVAAYKILPDDATSVAAIVASFSNTHLLYEALVVRALAGNAPKPWI